MFSYIDTNSSLQQSHPNHISHHHSHLSAHHPHQQGPPQPLSLDSNTQLPMLQSDGSPISAQMVSLTSAPLSVNSNMLHGLVANPTQVHSQSMMVNGGHMYPPAEEYTAMQSHYSVQATTAPQPPPPPLYLHLPCSRHNHLKTHNKLQTQATTTKSEKCLKCRVPLNQFTMGPIAAVRAMEMVPRTFTSNKSRPACRQIQLCTVTATTVAPARIMAQMSTQRSSAKMSTTTTGQTARCMPIRSISAFALLRSTPLHPVHCTT